MIIKTIKDKMNNQFVGSLVYLLSVNILFLFFFFIFRCINIITYWPVIGSIEDPALYKYLFTAITKGMRFDNIVVSYIMIAPLVIVPIMALFNRFNKKVIRIVNIYFSLCAFVMYAIATANIPYFEYFNKHISVSVLYWFQYSSETFGMLTGESTYLYYFLLFILIILLFVFFLRTIRQLITKYFNRELGKYKSYHIYIPILLLSYLLCMWGTRGWLIKRSLRETDVIFCQYLSVCQMAVNPIYYITGSLSSAQLHKLADEDKMKDIIKTELGFDISDNKYYINISSKDSIINANRPNIVFVFIESLASEYIDRNLENKRITPFISGLIDKSLYFDNFYSQGNHTNQGITASLYGIPSIFDKIMTTKAPIHLDLEMSDKYDDIRKKSPYLYGLPNNLKDLDYTNLFFVTHTIEYDNLNNFLPLNGFDLSVGSENYPKSEVVNTWGVSDKYLLNYSLNTMDSVANLKQPFLSAILTISNHPPYVYPKEFRDVSPNEDDCAIAYADDCIRQFMEDASQKEWYSNTIFVFLGDHGKRFNHTESLPLTFYHVPLIIYSPLLEDKVQKHSFLMGQIDLYPTLMGLMGRPANYKTFGIDVFSKKREYIYFSSDDKLGCINNDNFYYVKDADYGQEYLYKLGKRPFQELNIKDHKQMVDSMKLYSGSMLEGVKRLYKD